MCFLSPPERQHANNFDAQLFLGQSRKSVHVYYFVPPELQFKGQIPGQHVHAHLKKQKGTQSTIKILHKPLMCASIKTFTKTSSKQPTTKNKNNSNWPSFSALRYEKLGHSSNSAVCCRVPGWSNVSAVTGIIPRWSKMMFLGGQRSCLTDFENGFLTIRY